MSASTSFTAVGVGDELQVATGQSFSYAVSGTFVGTVVLERQDKGRGAWLTLLSATGAASGTLLAEEPGKSQARYRFRCTAYTSGTIVTVITELTTEVLKSLESGGDGHVRVTEDGVDLGGVVTATGAALASPKVTTGLGTVQAIERTFTETAGAGVYTASVAVPAGASIIDILIAGVALWNAATSATLKVGDAGDDDGYYTAVNLEATDLLAGESLSFALAGGKAGAYIANSQVSPRYSASARVISGVVTTVGGSGTTGRTRMTVVYHLPVSADIIAATKV